MIPSNKKGEDLVGGVSEGDTRDRYSDLAGEIEKQISDKMHVGLIDKMFLIGIFLWCISGLLAIAVGIKFLLGAN